jgi:predicted ATP-dependent endonuclease of OLD family
MMRLRKFEIHNFKGIRQASFEWDDIIILIGENNVGKSTVLQALDYFLSGTQIRDETLFNGHLTDADHAIELVGWFDHLSVSWTPKIGQVVKRESRS